MGPRGPWRWCLVFETTHSWKGEASLVRNLPEVTRAYGDVHSAESYQNNGGPMGGHRPFTQLTSKFSAQRKARVAEIKAEIGIAESHKGPSPLGEKVPRRGG